MSAPWLRLFIESDNAAWGQAALVGPVSHRRIFQPNFKPGRIP